MSAQTCSSVATFVSELQFHHSLTASLETQRLFDNDTSTCLGLHSLLETSENMGVNFYIAGTLNITVNYSVLNYIYVAIATLNTNKCEQLRILHSKSEAESCKKIRRCSSVSSLGDAGRCVFSCACAAQKCELTLAGFVVDTLSVTVCEITPVSSY